MKSANFPGRHPGAPQRQRGVALVIGLIVLLVLTMIGLSAIRTSTFQERMSSGYQIQSQTFQSAESAIRLVMSQLTYQPGVNLTLNPTITINTDLLSQARLNAPVVPLTAATATPNLTPAGAIPVIFSTLAADGTGFNARANLYFTGAVGAKITGSSMGKFSAFAYEINAVATQDTVGTRANNITSIWFLVPKQQQTF